MRPFVDATLSKVSRDPVSGRRRSAHQNGDSETISRGIPRRAPPVELVRVANLAEGGVLFDKGTLDCAVVVSTADAGALDISRHWPPLTAVALVGCEAATATSSDLPRSGGG